MTGARTLAGLPHPTARDLTLLCLLALVAYPPLWPEAPLHTGDSPQYLEVARDLADLRLDAPHDRSIGYPLLVAFTDRFPNPPRTLLFVSLLLHVASVWLLAVLLHCLGQSRHRLLLFGGLLLLPPFVEPAGHVMTENLAQFTLAAGLTCLVLWIARRRAWLLALSAAAFAYGALTRPAYQALAPALAICLLALATRRAGRALTARHALAAGATLVAATMLAIGAASWANYRAAGYFGLVPMTGYHLSTKTMDLWERLPEEHAQVREILVRARNVERTRRGGTQTGTQAIWQARAELLAATGMSKAELSGHLVRMNVALIRNAPIEYLQEVARSLAVYWFPPAGALATLDSTLLRWTWALLHGVVFGMFFLQIVVLAGVSVFEWSRRLGGARATGLPLEATTAQIAAYCLAATIVVYTMVLSCALDIGEVRQRRPTDALIVLMVFVAMQVWWQSIGPHGRDASTD